MKYEAPPEFEPENISKLLESNNDSDKINALLSIVLNSGNYDLSMKKSIEFTYSKSEWVRACGILCFGHIARIYGKIELEPVKEILINGLVDNSKIIAGKSEDAIEEITQFLFLDRKIFK